VWRGEKVGRLSSGKRVRVALCAFSHCGTWGFVHTIHPLIFVRFQLYQSGTSAGRQNSVW
jgi:hypothetical protein